MHEFRGQTAQNHKTRTDHSRLLGGHQEKWEGRGVGTSRVQVGFTVVSVAACGLVCGRC
jgi:hypothetical protein